MAQRAAAAYHGVSLQYGPTWNSGRRITMNFRMTAVFLAGFVVGVLGVGVAVYGFVPELREGKPVGYMEKFDPQCHPETGYLSGFWREGGVEGR